MKFMGICGVLKDWRDRMDVMYHRKNKTRCRDPHMVTSDENSNTDSCRYCLFL